MLEEAELRASSQESCPQMHPDRDVPSGTDTSSGPGPAEHNAPPPPEVPCAARSEPASSLVCPAGPLRPSSAHCRALPSLFPPLPWAHDRTGSCAQALCFQFLFCEDHPPRRELSLSVSANFLSRSQRLCGGHVSTLISAAQTGSQSAPQSQLVWAQREETRGPRWEGAYPRLAGL